MHQLCFFRGCSSNRGIFHRSCRERRGVGIRHASTVSEDSDLEAKYQSANLALRIIAPLLQPGHIFMRIASAVMIFSPPSLAPFAAIPSPEKQVVQILFWCHFSWIFFYFPCVVSSISGVRRRMRKHGSTARNHFSFFGSNIAGILLMGRGRIQKRNTIGIDDFSNTYSARSTNRVFRR